jgi:hypothetical protein
MNAFLKYTIRRMLARFGYGIYPMTFFSDAQVNEIVSDL